VTELATSAALQPLSPPQLQSCVTSAVPSRFEQIASAAQQATSIKPVNTPPNPQSESLALLSVTPPKFLMQNLSTAHKSGVVPHLQGSEFAFVCFVWPPAGMLASRAQMLKESVYDVVKHCVWCPALQNLLPPQSS
jgi:hypothetical protein